MIFLTSQPVDAVTCVSVLIPCFQSPNITIPHSNFDPTPLFRSNLFRSSFLTSQAIHAVTCVSVLTSLFWSPNIDPTPLFWSHTLISIKLPYFDPTPWFRLWMCQMTSRQTFLSSACNIRKEKDLLCQCDRKPPSIFSTAGLSSVYTISEEQALVLAESRKAFDDFAVRPDEAELHFWIPDLQAALLPWTTTSQ